MAIFKAPVGIISDINVVSGNDRSSLTSKSFKFMDGNTTLSEYAINLTNRVLTFIDDTTIYNSLKLESGLNTFGADNKYSAVYLASGNNVGICIVTGDVDGPIIEMFDASNYLSIVPNGIEINSHHIPVYYGSLASAPTGISEGDEYYSTSDSKFYKYNGTIWVALN